MRISTPIILSLLIIGAASYQYINHRLALISSFDEIIHIHLGQQIQENNGQYNTISLADTYKAKGHKLPAYFWDPLYKHPPFFPVLIGASLKLGLPPITPVIFLTGLTILLVFYLCRIFLNENISLLGAFLAAFDPIITGCSQKIWLDAPLACLMSASLYCFMQAVKNNLSRYFIYAGILAALAGLTKYPGLLLLPSFMLWAFLHQRNLWRNPYFISCLLLPLLALIPWVWLYLNSYQAPAQTLGTQHYFSSKGKNFYPSLAMAIATFLAFIVGNWLKLKPIKYILFLLITVLVIANLTAILNFWQPPSHSWTTYFFKNYPPRFYLDRLLQYSPILLLGLFGLCWKENEQPFLNILRIHIIVYLCVFIIWGSFQSRYIIPLVPALYILAMVEFERLSKLTSIRYLCWYLLFISLLKSLGNHLLLIRGNDFGYF